MSESSPYFDIVNKQSRAFRKAQEEERRRNEQYSELVFKQKIPAPLLNDNVNKAVAIYNRIGNVNPRVDMIKSTNEFNKKPIRMVPV